MTDILKAICVIVMIVCVCVMIYSIVNAIMVTKKNKDTDAATRRIFLARMGQTDKIGQHELKMNPVLRQPLSEIEPNKPKPLNYDEFEAVDGIDENSSGKSLNEFYQKKGQ